MFELAADRYGKSRIRLVTVRRHGAVHDLRDVTVDVALEGDFTAAHVDGDNANVVATDTMKNTVYALAKDRFTGSPEAFGLEIARHFAARPQVDRAHVTVREHDWSRIALAAGDPAPDAFVRDATLTRVASLTATKVDAAVEAGIEDLTVLKTTKSSFVGFERDRFTTLAEAEDRLMATKVTAVWRYGETAAEPGFDYDAAFERVRATLLSVFAEHHSPSVQTSIWVMGSAILEAEPAIDWIRMVLPNLHHWEFDLARFGIDNGGEVFVSTTEPHGLIDATVRRGG